MKKLEIFIIAILSFAFFQNCSTEDDTGGTPGEGTLEIVRLGDLNLKTQEEVDDFINSEDIEIQGNLQIGGDERSNISDISNLGRIRKITGDLIICKNPNLESLIGLESLKEAGESITITENSFLVDYSALQNLVENPGFKADFMISGNKYNPELETLKNGKYKFIQKKLRVRKVLSPQSGTVVYADSIFYNSIGKVESIKSYREGVLDRKVDYSYSASTITENRYSYFIGNDGVPFFLDYIRIQYTLVNNLIIEEKAYVVQENSEETFFFYKVHQNDNSVKNNNLLRSDSYDENGNLVISELYEYTDCLGSAIVKGMNGAGESVSETIFLKDDKVGWFQYYSVLDYQHAHNTIKQSTNHVTGEIFEVEYTFEYDEYGYPSRMERQDNYGPIGIIEFVFE